MRFINLLKSIPAATVRPFGTYVGLYQDEQLLLTIVPCANFRTKTLTALWSLPGSELEVVNLVVPYELPELQSISNLNKVVDAINTLFATYKPNPVDEIGNDLSYLGNVKLELYSTNGVHMERVGSVTAFAIGNTRFLEFTDLGESEPKTPVINKTPNGFEISYRGVLYGVKSKFEIQAMAEEDVLALIYTFIVNVHNK